MGAVVGVGGCFGGGVGGCFGGGVGGCFGGGVGGCFGGGVGGCFGGGVGGCFGGGVGGCFGGGVGGCFGGGVGGCFGGVVGLGIGALPDGGTVTIFPAPNIISFILLFPTIERSTTAALSESARNVLFAGSNIIRFPSVRVPWMMDRSLVFRRVNASPWITLISVPAAGE